MLSGDSRPQGSLPAFASGDVARNAWHHGATRIRPITGRRSLCPTPIPASLSVCLTASLPLVMRRGERYGLTTFRRIDTNGLGALCPPTAWVSMTGNRQIPVPAAFPFWAKPPSIFGLLLVTTFIESLRMLTLPSTPPHCRPDAGRYTVPSRFRCHPYGRGYVVRGLLTARCLAALPRRVPPMERQGGSAVMASNNQFCDFVSQHLLKQAACSYGR